MNRVCGWRLPRRGCLRVRLLHFAVLLAAVPLAGCTVFETGPDDALLPLYTAPGGAEAVQRMVASRVADCWFSGDEAFTGHSYEIQSAPHSQSGQVQVFKGTPQDKARGLAPAFFTADFRPYGELTEIDFPVQPDDKTLSSRLKTDVIRWANGSRDC